MGNKFIRIPEINTNTERLVNILHIVSIEDEASGTTVFLSDNRMIACSVDSKELFRRIEIGAGS